MSNNPISENGLTQPECSYYGKLSPFKTVIHKKVLTTKACLFKLNLISVNHFPRFYELTRKNLLAKNLKRFQKMMISRNKSEPDELRVDIDNEMDFFPAGFEQIS